MKGMVAKQDVWHPLAESVALVAQPDPRDKPLEFFLTPAERAKFCQPATPGLEVRELSASDLTKSEQMALGIRGVSR